MGKATLLLFVIGFAACGVASIIMARTAETTAATLATGYVQHVPGPSERIAQSRETAAAEDARWGLVWVLGGVLVVAAGITVMVVGRPFLKEVRLTMKSAKRKGNGQRRQRPYGVPTVLPAVRQVPQLGDGERQWENDESQSGYSQF